MLARILVCTDGSDHALNAARTAAEIAAKFGSKVTLLTVLQPLALTVPPMCFPEGGSSIDPYLQDADGIQGEIMDHTGRIFDSLGVSYTRRRELGHPVDIITDVAEEEHADLIVMGSRGLGGFRRFVLGSTSDGVLHHAHCPVLIAR